MKRTSILAVIAMLAAVSVFGQAPIPVEFNNLPARILGQQKRDLVSVTPNQVEGRELYLPSGIAVDTTVTPNVVYVSDAGNNRVLFWRAGRTGNGLLADGVIGQPDFFTTLPGGPGNSSNSVGLNQPSGMAVDSRGNLYIVDTANNRILRFRKPYEAGSEGAQPNLVIGQNSFSTNQPNLGLTTISARSLAFSSGSNLAYSNIAIDRSDNLWVPDTRNNRVLRFPASALSDSAPNGPSADLVIGEFDFTTRTETNFNVQNGPLIKNALRTPVAAAFDPSGRLYVSDQIGRVLVYSGGFVNGMSASRVLGISVNAPGQPARPPVNEYNIGFAQGLVFQGANLFVLDAAFNRVVRYEPFESWAAETTNVPSPPATYVSGQATFNEFEANRGAKRTTEVGLYQPSAAVIVNNEFYIADAQNNRVTVSPMNGLTLNAPSRVYGQLGLTNGGANLVEARDLFLRDNFLSIGNGTLTSLSGGVVVDRSSNPPRLYIADTYNHRIVAYADARRAGTGAPPDLIIGQANSNASIINSPAGDPERQTDTGLNLPTGLAADRNGNLWVADRGNGRLLRFPKPFDQPAGTAQRATLVLGQSGFNIKITDPTRTNMSAPVGIALTADGDLVASDTIHNRVLLFKRNAAGDFTNGQQATTVFGQPNFNSITTSDADNRLNAPNFIATDTDDRVYVADLGKNRIVVYDRVGSSANDPAPVLTLRGSGDTTFDTFSSPQGIAVSALTGEIWVADTQRNRMLRFPKFDTLFLNPRKNFEVTNVFRPLGVALDSFENLIIPEGSNRVSLYFPKAAALNSASYLERPISPGMVASLYPYGIRFGDKTKTFNELPKPLPLPLEIEDIELLIDDKPVPLYFVSPGQINFFVPKGTPESGTVEVLVQRKSVGQILASATLPVGPATPGFFTATQNGSGQIASLNEDNSVNSPTNAVGRGQVIQLYGTGQGVVPNAPADGEPATVATPTPVLPRVVIGSDFVPEANILYSGLAPNLVGVWQINVRVPTTVAPGNAVLVAVTLRGVPSTTGTNGRRVDTTIAVK